MLSKVGALLGEALDSSGGCATVGRWRLGRAGDADELGSGPEPCRAQVTRRELIRQQLKRQQFVQSVAA